MPKARSRQLRGYLHAMCLVMLAAGLAVITGCATFTIPSAGDQPRDGGTLIVGQYQEVTQFDPNRQYSWETWRIDRNIYETLVDEDLSTPQGVPKIVPKLATTWQVSPDYREFTFHLRRGVTFTDGTPFDAQAVLFNVRRFHDPTFEYYDKISATTMGLVYADLDGLDVIDQYTVRYRFKHPYQSFLRQIPNSGNAPSGFFSPAALKQYGQDGLSDHPVGTGPFVLQERIRGDHTTLVRNTHYWGQRPYLDRVIFKPILDDQSRVAALRTDTVDLISRVPPNSVQSLESAGFSVPVNHGVPQIIYYNFNFTNKYLHDKRVRQAIIHAVNRQEIANTIYHGYASAATSILNQGNEAYDPHQVDYAYDPEQSRALLAQAGYRPGEVKFTILADLTGQPTAEYLQQSLRDVGINATVQSYEWLTYGTRTSNLTPNDGLYLGEWGYITPDWLRIAYDRSVTARGGGPFSDTTPATVAAIERAAVNTDPARSTALWQQASRAFAADASIVPLLSFNRYYAFSRRVGGFVWPQQNHYDLSKVWVAP